MDFIHFLTYLFLLLLHAVTTNKQEGSVLDRFCPAGSRLVMDRLWPGDATFRGRYHLQSSPAGARGPDSWTLQQDGAWLYTGHEVLKAHPMQSVGQIYNYSIKKWSQDL